MTPLNRCPICGRTWLDGSPMACDHSWAEWEQHRKREAEPEGELALSPRQRLRKALLDRGKRAEAAEARVKVLEEALRQIADARMPGEARRIARAALASKEEGGR